MKNNNFFKKFDIVKIVGFIFIFLVCLVYLYLLYWVAVSSVKNRFDFNENVLGLPSAQFGWKFSNFIDAFKYFYIPLNGGRENVYFLGLILNTVSYSVGCALFSTISHFLAAYICARYNFALKGIIYKTVIIAMLIPIGGTLAAELKVARILGFYGSIWGQWIMKISFLGTHFLIFYAAVKGLSNTYAEAAKIDGAGNFSILLKIYSPMLFPIIFGIFIMQFIGFWNDFYTPMYYLPSNPTLSYGLYKIQFSNITGVTIPIIFAACFISAFPVIVIFIIFRNKFLGNITMGGIKG